MVAVLVILAFIGDLSVIYALLAVILWFFILLSCKSCLKIDPLSLLSFFFLAIPIVFGLYVDVSALLLLIYFLFFITIQSEKELFTHTDCLVLSFFHFMLIFVGAIGYLYPDVPLFINQILGTRNDLYLDYSIEGGFFRSSSFLSNPNYFSQVSFLILCFFIILSRSYGLIKYLGFNFVLFVVASVMSGSRASILCLFLLVFLSAPVLLGRFSSFRYISLVFLSGFLIIGFSGVGLPDLRSLDFVGLFKSTSGLQRFDDLWLYFSSYLSGERAPLSLIIGNGFQENEGIVFDQDVGNLLYQFGLIGAFLLICVVVVYVIQLRLQLVFIPLIPFMLGGGVLGNLKLILVFSVIFTIAKNVNERSERGSRFE